MAKNTSISLGDHFEGYVEGKVTTGRYGNRSEVIREALRRMEAEDQKESTLEMIQRSLEDIRAGRTQPAEEAIQEIADQFGLDLGA